MHFWKRTKYPVVGSFVEHTDVVPQHMLTHVKTSVRLFSKGVGEDCWQLWESSRLIEDACKMLHRTLLRIKDVVPCCSMLFHVVPGQQVGKRNDATEADWNQGVLGPLLLKKAFRTGRRLFQSQRHGAQWERNGSGRCRCSAIVSIARGT